MPDMTDELNEIGAVLAAAGSGESVELTDQQRAALASASTADVLFGIVQHMPSFRRLSRRRQSAPAVGEYSRAIDQIDQIAAAWANECRAAFANPLTQQRIKAALATDQPLAGIADFIREDNRLASYERETLLRVIGNVATSQAGAAALSKTAYLSQLSVAGFRGIGQHAELNVAPYPGLTIVYGANGSGKSSFAEALDVLLTGTTGRFAGRGFEWRSAQTNVHEPQDGYVRGVFDLEGYETNGKPFIRFWTGDGYLTDAYDLTPTGNMRAIGWLDALDEFKPVLGYAELGPLLDEDAFGEVADSEFAGARETSLARHIRLRTGISDPLLSTIQRAVAHKDATAGQPFRQELSAWYRLRSTLSVGGNVGVHFPTNDGLTMTVTSRWKECLAALALSGRRSGRSKMLLHPREFNWGAFFDTMERNATGILPDPLRNRNEMTNRFVQHMVVPLLDLCRDFITHEHRSILRSQTGTLGWTSRTHVYCEMLIEAIYRERLAKLSRDVGELWRRIRPGSSVQFHGIELRNVSQAGQPPVFRASLDLSLDGVRGVERGVLSQGELYSMALSLFLPTMTRPESPFGFAMIDDPVQVMDQYAVEGLARVLDEYANALQLIVFTHDDRLIKALRRLEIDHTLINVTRSTGSVVQCEVIDDPVKQRLADARSEAKRPASHDKIGRRQDVGDQCRRAIEAMCIRAARKRRAREDQGLTSKDVEDEIDLVLQNSVTSTRLLLALAIFGDTDEEKVGNVGRFVSKSANWGRWVDRTIRRVNGLAHASDEETARAVYAGDLHKLIDDVERLTQTIEANCG